MGKQAAEEEVDPLAGTTVNDRFEVKSRIARGGMSAIYHAVQVDLGRDVALKVMRAGSDADTAEDFARRMLNEAAGAAKLRHPNTIVIHDYGHLPDGRCFIAMELLEGRTLLDEIEELGHLDVERAVHIALQITGSLAEAHEAGMIHRDLKPGNVMLMKRGADTDFVKVVDFGLVKHDAKDTEAEDSGALVGTPRYMAPEQVRAEAVTEHTDVYGLGATLYHALTGRPPFDSPSRFALMAAHMTQQPKSLSQVTADKDIDIPPAIEAVVMRCLQKDREARFANMGELADALVAALGGELPSTMRASLPPQMQPVLRVRSRSGAVEVDALADTMGELEPKRPPRSGLWGAVAAATLALIGGAAWLATRPAPDTATPPEVATVNEQPAAGPVRTEPVTPTEVPAAPTEVVVTTTPAHASLHRGDDDLGNAPLTLAVPSGEEWTLEVSAPGYVARTVTVTGAERQISVRLQRRRGRGRASESTATPPRSDNRDPWAEEGSSGSR